MTGCYIATRGTRLAITMPHMLSDEATDLTHDHPRAMIGLYGIIGVVAAALCTWGFLILVDEIPEHGWMARVDTAATAWLQSAGTERGESAFVFVSLFGSPILAAVVLIVAAVLVRRKEWQRLRLLAAASGGGAVLNLVLKAIFHRARPAVSIEFHPASPSFPSGHAMNAMVTYGLLGLWAARAYPAYRWSVITLTAFLIALIGFARVYLGVHYLSDVAAGYSVGIVWLTTCILAARIDEAVAHRKHSDRTTGR